MDREWVAMGVSVGGKDPGSVTESMVVSPSLYNLFIYLHIGF